MLTLTPIAGFAVAFVLALTLTPWVRRLAMRLEAIDPRTATKLHAHDVPRLGGLAIAAAFYVPLVVLALRDNLYQSALYEDPLRATALLLGGLVILGLGVFDDLHGARAWQKLVVQIPVAILAWWAGIRIGGGTRISGEIFAFGPILSLLVTVVWIVGVVNALNLIDGLDGLASGLALQALVAVALCAWHRDQPVLALVAVCLGGAVGGFLLHNFHPASIFMGDSGSMFLGYVLAISSTWTLQKGATAIGVVLPALAMGLPLLDTSLAVWRRLHEHRPILVGDLDHIHHRFMRIGWSHTATVLALYAIGLLFSGLSVVLIYSADPRMVWPVATVGVAIAVSLARWLGYLGPPMARGDAATQRRNLIIKRASLRLQRRLLTAHKDHEVAAAVAEFEDTLATTSADEVQHRKLGA